MLYGNCFRLCCYHCALALLEFLDCVVLGALLLPWGSLARWLASLISSLPWRLTRLLHGRSPCTLSHFYWRVYLSWPAWMCCAIMRCCFLEGPCYPFPAGLIYWNGDCLLILLFGLFSSRWLVLVLLHDWCLIQLLTFSSQPCTTACSVEDLIYQEEGIDNS